MADKEDRYIAGQIEDKIRQADSAYMVTHTGFLDPHAQAIAGNIIKSPGSNGIEKILIGGYEEAERRILLCLPDYAKADEAEAEVLKVIRASVREGGRVLRHGDYLGSLTGLGLDRQTIGDILVREDGADIIVLAEIVEFLMTNYEKAGRSYLSLEELPIGELMIPEQDRIEETDTVASLRLDNIVATGFGISRAKAQEAIRRGIVFVNSREDTKADREVAAEDRIVLRGKGRIAIKDIGGTSRKGRQYVTFIKYK